MRRSMISRMPKGAKLPANDLVADVPGELSVSDPRVLMAATLEALAAAGQLPEFIRLYPLPHPSGMGNCHQISSVLAAELRAADIPSAQWVLATITAGKPPHRMLHSWVEVHGKVAINASNGQMRIGLVSEFYRTASPTDVHYNMTLAEFERLKAQRAKS
jgi:hypothetical protein